MPGLQIPGIQLLSRSVRSSRYCSRPSPTSKPWSSRRFFRNWCERSVKRFFGRAKIGTFDAEVRQSMWFSNTGNFLPAPRLGGPQSRAVGWRTEDVESRIDGLATNGHRSVVQSTSHPSPYATTVSIPNFVARVSPELPKLLVGAATSLRRLPPSASTIGVGLIGLGASHPRTGVCKLSVAVSIGKVCTLPASTRRCSGRLGCRRIGPWLLALSYCCTILVVGESRIIEEILAWALSEPGWAGFEDGPGWVMRAGLPLSLGRWR